MEEVRQQIQEKAQNYPLKEFRFIEYGTAGFRKKASELDYVMFRMGILAVLRSKSKRATIGVMITASHNPEEDNGVKLIDPMGEMLEKSWELIASSIASVPDSELIQKIENILAETNIVFSIPATVFVARDTRESSPRLSQALCAGIAATGGNVVNYEVLTTPQLHFMVKCFNTKGEYGEATEKGYYDKLSSAFCKLMSKIGGQNSKYKPELVVDAANGVGASKLQELRNYINSFLKVTIVNDGSSGKLNHQCGADYVKVQQKCPLGINMMNGQRYASYDGDADRIVYFYADKDGKFHLMDGDKIATLVAGYLKSLVADLGLDIKLGLVQTAYANNSSTNYITQNLQVEVACVETGVKHLHHRAQEFDIGVYFEANGHGTVLFSDKATKLILDTTKSPDMAKKQKAETLENVMNVINQTVGDAMSDMLLVEFVLAARNCDIEQWDQEYTDLPSRQLKVKVKDRSIIATIDASRKVVKPKGLQEAIDQLVAKYKNGRSFVRPSGTEDVVRVYAEADTQENADNLGYEVSLEVYKMSDGVGDHPQKP